MTSASLASRIGAVALCVGLSAAPWLRVLGDDCPGAAAGTCGTEPSDSDCPCAPDGGYHDCGFHKTEAKCKGATGHHAEDGPWTCAAGSKGAMCVLGTVRLCWTEFACKWDETENGECVLDEDVTIDHAQYVAKKVVPCGSGSGSK